MWGRKRRMGVPDDTGEAQAIRAEAKDELHALHRQSVEVASISRKLARRRELNHFGDELTLTFRPRGGHI